MPKHLLVCILFCLSFYLLSAQTEGIERVAITGEIRDMKMTPVSYAHILSKSRNEGWVGDYYGTFRAEVFPGDTLIVSAISYHHFMILIPENISAKEYKLNITMDEDTVFLKELVVHPFPATYEQLRREFMKVEIEDPAASLDLNLPSMKDLAALARTPGIPGQIGIYSGSSPISLLYDQFSKEARSKRMYAEVMKREKADSRYNKVVVSRITGLKNDDDIRKFMEFCALQIKFILESSDYELYAAILNCYDEFCQAGFQPDSAGE